MTFSRIVTDILLTQTEARKSDLSVSGVLNIAIPIICVFLGYGLGKLDSLINYLKQVQIVLSGHIKPNTWSFSCHITNNSKTNLIIKSVDLLFPKGDSIPLCQGLEIDSNKSTVCKLSNGSLAECLAISLALVNNKKDTIKIRARLIDAKGKVYISKKITFDLTEHNAEVERMIAK